MKVLDSNTHKETLCTEKMDKLKEDAALAIGAMMQSERDAVEKKWEEHLSATYVADWDNKMAMKNTADHDGQPVYTVISWDTYLAERRAWRTKVHAKNEAIYHKYHKVFELLGIE